MSDYQDVIEAFTDGESVDPRELKQALSLPEGREHLIDLLALRGLVGGGAIARPAAPAAAPAMPRASRVFRVAAALALASGLTAAGFLIGQRQAGTTETDDGGAPAMASTPASAPEPTRVIRLKNGVDWTERTGGN